MDSFARSALSLLFGGLLVSVIWTAPAKSADGPITLRVPLELKQMIAAGVRVSCSIWGDDASQGAYLGIAYQMFPIENGEFNQVVEMVVQPSAGKNFVGAKTYRCAFDLKENAQSQYHFPPEQGPAGQDLWKIAKPGEFFRRVVTGQLSGVAVGGAPKNLKLK